MLSCTEAFQTGVAYVWSFFRRPIDAGNALRARFESLTWSRPQSSRAAPRAKTGRAALRSSTGLAHLRYRESCRPAQRIGAGRECFRFICRAVGISHAHATESECANDH